MRRAFLNASLRSLMVYALAVLSGVWIGFWFTLAVIPVFQITWMTFCGARIVQLRRAGAHIGFSIGGLVSSCGLLPAIVVLSQVVTNTGR